MDNELAQVDRGLYGANAHYRVRSHHQLRRAARIASTDSPPSPARWPSCEEFRGTGGSLYFLRHQDILPGSERVRIELRDKDSGLVTGVVNLRPAIDYDIDYLQGRVLLSEPLSSTADDNLLVRSGGVSGDEAYLVVRYEYTPGFDELDAVAVGGQGHYWFNDHVKLGLTANANDEGDADSSLERRGPDPAEERRFVVQAADRPQRGAASPRRCAPTTAASASTATTTWRSPTRAPMAYRADLSVGLGDFFDERRRAPDALHAEPGRRLLGAGLRRRSRTPSTTAARSRCR